MAIRAACTEQIRSLFLSLIDLENRETSAEMARQVLVLAHESPQV